MYPISENSFLDMGEFEEMKRMEERINNRAEKSWGIGYGWKKPYIQDIFLSTAEEGSTLEISLSSDWDKIYYIQEELISEEENSYIIDTILSFVPYTPEETIPSETETQAEVEE